MYMWVEKIIKILPISWDNARYINQRRVKGRKEQEKKKKKKNRKKWVLENNKTGLIIMGGGRNVEFQNYDWRFFSERQNGLFSWSEHRKSKRSECQKCLLSWSLLRHHYYNKKKTFDVVILPMASKKITTSKIKNIFLNNYLWCITYGYQGLWGVRLGSIRLG